MAEFHSAVGRTNLPRQWPHRRPETGPPNSQDPYWQKLLHPYGVRITHPTGYRSDRPHLERTLNLGGPRLYQFSVDLGIPGAPNS